jgi:hypothetical protein
MKQEAIDTKRSQAAAASVTLGNWLIILWQFGVRTPADQIGNEEVDLILARIEGMAREKKGKDVR